MYIFGAQAYKSVIPDPVLLGIIHNLSDGAVGLPFVRLYSILLRVWWYGLCGSNYVSYEHFTVVRNFQEECKHGDWLERLWDP